MTDFFLVSLAVWRLSRFIRKENGPGNKMKQFNQWVQHVHRNYESKEGTIAELLTCNKCLSFWLAVAATIAWSWADRGAYTVPVWIGMPWAISGLAIFVDYVDEIYGPRAKLGKNTEALMDTDDKYVNWIVFNGRHPYGGGPQVTGSGCDAEQSPNEQPVERVTQ